MLFNAAEVGVQNPRYTLKFESDTFDVDEISGVVSLKSGAVLDYDRGPRLYTITVITSTFNGMACMCVYVYERERERERERRDGQAGRW